jgi:hypothetical protein
MRTLSTAQKPADETPPAKEEKPANEDKSAKEDKPAKEVKPTKEDKDTNEMEDVDEADDESPEDGEVVEKKHKKKAPRKTIGKKSKSERKRGPARPYRKLPQETLESRIKKLQKRIERTSAQAEEGRTFLSKYTREQAFRETETEPVAG